MISIIDKEDLLKVIIATIDEPVDWLSDKYELTEAEGCLLMDIVRDNRQSVNSPLLTRQHLARSREAEMYDICELFNHNIKYQPDRLKDWKQRLCRPALNKHKCYKQKFN